MMNTRVKLIGMLSIMIIGTLTFTSCSNNDGPLEIDTAATIEQGVAPDIVVEEVTPAVMEEANSEDYGAHGAELKTEFTLEEMMQYALEDEYLAYAEYELIINEMNLTRPFSNIIRAEATHIGYMEDLYETYGFELPSIDPSEHVVLPESANAAFLAGVDAEIINIAMYDKFLEQELPDDVRLVFEHLKAGSESHLSAFQKNVR